MAITSTDKLIDLNRLGAFLTKLRNTFVAKVEGKDLSDNNLTDEMVAQIAKIETLIAEGGEPNKIEVVKVNGTAQTITDKAVDLQVPEVSYKGDFDTVGAEGRINTKGSNSDDAIIFTKTAEGVSISASIDEGNEVFKGFQAIKVYSKEKADETFRTEAQVNDAITAALADITGVSFQLVDELPAEGESGVFYLKPITGGKSKNLYEEFVWVNKGTTEAPDFDFESLGPTSVDLTGYLKDTDITLATTEDIDGLFTPATGE